MKIGFDFDLTLSRLDIQEIAKKALSDGHDVYVVTRRYSNELGPVYLVAKKVGIKKDNIFSTEGAFKYMTVALLDLDLFYDDKFQEVELIKCITPNIRTIHVV